MVFTVNLDKMTRKHHSLSELLNMVCNGILQHKTMERAGITNDMVFTDCSLLFSYCRKHLGLPVVCPQAQILYSNLHSPH